MKSQHKIVVNINWSRREFDVTLYLLRQSVCSWHVTVCLMSPGKLAFTLCFFIIEDVQLECMVWKYPGVNLL